MQQKAFDENRRELQHSHELHISEHTKVYQSSTDQLATELTELRRLYADSVSECESKLNLAKQMVENAPSRQCDLDKIAALSCRLELATSALQTAVREAADYQRLFAIREKEYTRRFGQHPTVGVFDSRCHSTRC
jgi:hypothetical protein